MSLIILLVLFYYFRYSENFLAFLNNHRVQYIDSLGVVFSVISAVIGWIVMAIAYEIIRKLHIYLLKNVFSKFIKTITNSQWFRITSIFLIIILAYELSNILISKGVIIRFDFSPTLSLTLLSAYVIFYAFLYTEQKHDGKEDNFYPGFPKHITRNS